MMQARACPQCGEDNPGRAKFCLECGHRFPVEVDDVPRSILDSLPSDDNVSGERRVVTVLFADLAGFTAYSEGSDVEDVHALADETAEKLGEIVERYGGYVDKIIGDCVMAVFGAPTSHEDDPERAVRSALDMQAHVAEFTDRFARLQLTIGLNTGEVIWAPVGPGGRHTVLGDTVNTAARLQGAASKGQVLIGEETARAVAEAIKLDEVEPVRAKNKAEPVPAWLAVGIVGALQPRRAVRSAILGRDRELSRLHEIWQRVQTEKRPYLVTVTGPAGIGKSRVVDALSSSIGEGATVLRGRCLPYGEGITYWPVIEIINTSAEIEPADDRVSVSAKLGALLEGLGSQDLDEMRTMAVCLAHLIGSPTTPRGTYTATEISRGELHWGLRRILELAARSNELVLVLEDLHWAEPTLLDLIAFITDSQEAAPILAIATGRPEFAATAGAMASRANHRVFTLESLDNEDARHLVREIVGDDVSKDAVERLVRSAGGNPLFLEELARLLLDEGEASSIPDGLNAVIAARLDRLTSAERRVVARASVIGNVFWSGTVRYLVGDDADVAHAFELLEERDLIRARRSSAIEDEREYEFKHGLLREVAYARLTKAERASLHGRCSEWVAGRPGGEDEFAEIIAYHLEQACLLAREIKRSTQAPPLLKAVAALMKAAERAESHEGTREATRFYERALTIVGDDLPETVADLRLRRARTRSLFGELEAAAAEFGAVAAAATEIGRHDLACRALVNLADVDLTLGLVGDGRTHLARADEIAQRIEDRPLLVRTAFVRSVFLTLEEGGAEAAVDVLRDAIEIAEQLGDDVLRLAGHLRLGTLYYNLGEIDRAQEELVLTAKLAAERGSLQVQAMASRFLGTIGFQLGPRDEAEELTRQTLTWMERIGQPLMQSEVLQLLAQFAMSRDDVEAGEALLLDALRLTSGSAVNIAEVNRYLAEVEWRLGRPGQARRAAAAARAAAPADDEHALAMASVAEAFAAAAANDPAAARERFAVALDLLDDPGLVTDKAEVELALGRYHVACGDRAEGRMRLEAARTTFADIGAVASVGDVDEALTALH